MIIDATFKEVDHTLNAEFGVLTRGEKGEKGEQGDKGEAGKIKFIVVTELPTEDIDENAIYMKPLPNPEGTNTYEEYIYVEGAWESIGTTSVEVDLTNYVKNTDYASPTNAGVIRVNGNGLNVINGTLYVISVDENMINQKTDARRPITSKYLDYAVKVGVTTNTIPLTDEEKTAAQNWLGLGDIETALDSIIAIQEALMGGGNV